jgi:hypothetical protein
MKQRSPSPPAQVDVGGLAIDAGGEPDLAQVASAWRRWGLIAALLFAAAAVWLASATPQPQPIDAPVTVFSAARAMADVRAIAAHPHPSGSPDAARVRDYLVSRLGAIGVDIQVQHAEGVLRAAKHKPGVVIAGMADNVIGVMPGLDRNAPALLIMSHYDTMPNSPGAGDDTIGGATALEIARILKGEVARQRDVIFLFTDGEEPGLLGAQAFFSGHPLARHVGVILNLEARGDAGRVSMFEANPGAGGLIRLLGGRSATAGANSLMTALYRVMPNDTDLSVALGHGYAGLNFAIAGDQLSYHTSLMTPDHLDQGSVQHMGDVVLPVARDLATARSLPSTSPDLTYSDVMGRWLIAYPPPVGWALVALSALLVGFVVVQARRRGSVGGWQLARGAGALLVATMAAVLALHLCGRLLGGENSVRVYALVARYPLLLAGCAAITLGVGCAAIAAVSAGWPRLPFALAVAAVAAACSLTGLDLAAAVLGAVIVVLALACLGRSTSLWGLWSGGLVFGLVLAVALQIVDPVGAFIVQWPLLLGCLAAAAGLALDFSGHPRAAWTAVGVIGALAAAQVFYWASGFFLQMGPVAPEILAFAVPLALLVLAPGLHALAKDGRATLVGLAAIVAGATMLVLVGGVGWPGASPRQLTQLFYLANPQKSVFLRANATSDLDPWTRSVFGEKPVSVRMPLVASGHIWTGPAPPAALAGPNLSVDTAPIGPDLDLRLHVRPGGQGRQLKILIQPIGDLRDLTLNGRPQDALKEAAGMSLGRLMIVYTAPPPDGIVIGLRAHGHGRFAVTALESRDGWPPGAAPATPKPAALLTWGLSDTTVVQSDLDYRW